MKFSMGTSWWHGMTKTVPPVVRPDMSGRVIIVTGSNTGIGYETALHFARLNPAKLILAVRNVQAGQAAALKIATTTGCKEVEVWNLDLGDLKNTKAFGLRAQKELERLDVVVSNAGLALTNYTLTKDGYETTSQVNNIANSLLSVLLLPILLHTAKLPSPSGSVNMKPHLTIVASEVHYWINGTLPGMKQGRKDTLQCFQEEKLFDMAARYNESKAVNVLNTRTIAQLVGPSVIVNCVTPGLCKSELMRDAPPAVATFMNILKAICGRTTEEGSRSFVWAGTQDTPPGSYVNLSKVTEASDFVISKRGAEIGQEIWNEMKAIWKDKVGVDADMMLGIGR